MHLVELIHLKKVYQTGKLAEIEVIPDLNLRIDPGEYLALMGPSGSGKSTLLHLLGCLDRPTNGTYLLDGIDVSGLSDEDLSRVRNRKIGFVFQSFHLIPEMTVLENVELAMEKIDQVGLFSRARHRPSELSGGQQQRAAIARALVADPLMILADEPTGNLDRRTGRDILDIFDTLSRRGRTLVVVTHDDFVGSRAGQIIRMADGQIQSTKTAMGPAALSHF